MKPMTFALLPLQASRLQLELLMLIAELPMVLLPPPNKIIWPPAVALVEVVEEGEDVEEEVVERIQEDFVQGREAVLWEGRTIAQWKSSTCSNPSVSIYPSLALSGISSQIVIPGSIQSWRGLLIN
jgi:hypothetical protein